MPEQVPLAPRHELGQKGRVDPAVMLVACDMASKPGDRGHVDSDAEP